uniref:Uncharacterized protein n=1 Tax=Nelumbo nucifera TaxID=4432 RepID=A0A822ZIU4_NELNU|nr:TPA_asm: hypothetical protein HUJ06_002710 [Nelumbo nucifera]
MARKGSTIKAAPMKEEEPVTEQEKIKPKRKKLGQEIDEIFSNKKLKKAEEQQMEKATEDGIEKPKKKKKKNKFPKKDGFVDPPPRERKRTEDGFAIYTEEELGIVKSDAGGTPLCPFDCSVTVLEFLEEGDKERQIRAPEVPSREQS